MKNANITTTRQLRESMARAYRRTNGETLTVTLPGATVRVPAFLSVDVSDINGDTVPEVINVGYVILDAVRYHTREWGLSERKAMEELAQRWVDMVTHPSAPAVDIVAIDWVLDLHTLVTGHWAE